MSYGCVETSGTIEFNFSSVRLFASFVGTNGGFSILFDGTKESSSRVRRRACSSSSAAKCATPDMALCVIAPPSSSFVTVSCVTVLITSGPVMNIYEVSLTITLKSVIAGE